MSYSTAILLNFFACRDGQQKSCHIILPSFSFVLFGLYCLLLCHFVSFQLADVSVWMTWAMIVFHLFILNPYPTKNRNTIWNRRLTWKSASVKGRRNCWLLANIPAKHWKRPKHFKRPTSAWTSTWASCNRESEKLPIDRRPPNRGNGRTQLDSFFPPSRSRPRGLTYFQVNVFDREEETNAEKANK